MTVYDCESKQQVVPVWDVDISGDAENGSATAPFCQLRHRSDAASDIFKSWRYGGQLFGYEMKGCAPLVPGKYFLSVDSRPSPVSVRFEIVADGEVHMEPDEGCKK